MSLSIVIVYISFLALLLNSGIAISKKEKFNLKHGFRGAKWRQPPSVQPPLDLAINTTDILVEEIENLLQNPIDSIVMFTSPIKKLVLLLNNLEKLEPNILAASPEKADHLLNSLFNLTNLVSDLTFEIDATVDNVTVDTIDNLELVAKQIIDLVKVSEAFNNKSVTALRSPFINILENLIDRVVDLTRFIVKKIKGELIQTGNKLSFAYSSLEQLLSQKENKS